MTSPSPTALIDLAKLPRLKELFALFNSGRHLNRLAEPALWAELERETAQYELLFATLGYELRIDGRGYAWFQTSESSASVSKTTRQLALLFMLIFEHQADAGQHLGRFVEWRIDRVLLVALLEKNRQLLEAESLADADALQSLLDAASRYGFAETVQGGWRLLPAAFRYLDRFEELATDQQQVAIEVGATAPGDEGDVS